MKPLNEKELEKVTGGFQETNKSLPTRGLNIICPACHSTKAHSFSKSALYDDKLGTVEYQCKCGCSFVISHGKAIKKNDFLNLCKQKGIAYPFK